MSRNKALAWSVRHANARFVESFEFEVDESDGGSRLDVVLVRRVPGMSRTRAKAWTEEGKVRVNGRIARRGVHVTAGDRVSVETVPPRRDFAALPDASLALDVLHEDSRLVVVEKPAGIPIHPLRPEELGTLANALVARYPELAQVGYSPREPGIVHRLDTDTSGVVVAARDANTFSFLTAALRAGRFDKRYRALCAGAVLAPRTIDLPIAHDPKDPRRVVACLRESDIGRLRAKPAETEILSAEYIGRFSLVEVRARSARRHQVRAHLAAFGHPLAGDTLYGGPPRPGLDRHFLHASAITFPHPEGRTIEVVSALPPTLVRIVEAIRKGG